MALGVPADEFWNGNYTMLKFYVDRHRIAVEQKNEELWLQGLYNFEALTVAISRALDKHSSAKYPEKPHRLTPLSEDEKKAEADKKVEEFRAQLNALGRKFEAKHKREQQEKERQLTQQGGENLGS